MPASVYGLPTKGLIWEGMDADLCIFDAQTIRDKAEFTACNQRAEGLNYVILGGEIAVKDAVYQGAKTGRLLLRQR
jgi:N-acyl-D-aspartate/D-glutamate deacylase